MDRAEGFEPEGGFILGNISFPWPLVRIVNVLDFKLFTSFGRSIVRTISFP